jgi:hypothetical protein
MARCVRARGRRARLCAGLLTPHQRDLRSLDGEVMRRAPNQAAMSHLLVELISFFRAAISSADGTEASGPPRPRTIGRAYP